MKKMPKKKAKRIQWDPRGSILAAVVRMDPAAKFAYERYIRGR